MRKENFVAKEDLRKKDEETPDVEGHLKDDFGAKDDFGEDFGRKDDEDDFEGHALRDDFGDDFGRAKEQKEDFS
jgi:hypothetical protein